jgi:2-keto-4-pentenoate hydratase/2-oxohepta-3-ene-1,7-dioic acid hydratase in catechol pathway
MRISSLTIDDASRPFVVEDDTAHELDCPGGLLDLIASGADPAALGRRGSVPLADAPEPDAPLRPGKVVAIGLNYRDHAREAGIDVPERPLVFAKFPSSVIGTGAAIELPLALTERVDWEVELAVIIGHRMRSGSERDALDHVFGYTVANDVSARDIQIADGQWVRSKSFDTFCPLGPVVVTRAEVPDPQVLRLRTRVNGETVQDSSTAEMVFGVAELLAFCSQSFPLEPGDVLLTGTPWGCGEFMEPRRSLQPGDVVECEIDGIGTLRNPVVAGSTSTR